MPVGRVGARRRAVVSLATTTLRMDRAVLRPKHRVLSDRLRIHAASGLRFVRTTARRRAPTLPGPGNFERGVGETLEGCTFGAQAKAGIGSSEVGADLVVGPRRA